MQVTFYDVIVEIHKKIAHSTLVSDLSDPSDFFEEVWYAEYYIVIINPLSKASLYILVHISLVAHQRFLCALKAHFVIQNALLMRIKSAGVLPGINPLILIMLRVVAEFTDIRNIFVRVWHAVGME